MPSYDIRYLNDDGTLAAAVAAECVDETKAKVLAHALKSKGFKRIEVWDGADLIYERPQRARSYRRAGTGLADGDGAAAGAGDSAAVAAGTSDFTSPSVLRSSRAKK